MSHWSMAVLFRRLHGLLWLGLALPAVCDDFDDEASTLGHASEFLVVDCLSYLNETNGFFCCDRVGMV
jgi:hypothetical protein